MDMEWNVEEVTFPEWYGVDCETAVAVFHTRSLVIAMRNNKEQGLCVSFG